MVARKHRAFWVSRPLVEATDALHVEGVQVLVDTITVSDKIHLAGAVIVADQHDAAITTAFHNPAARCRGPLPA